MSKAPHKEQADPGSPPTKGKAAASPAPLIPLAADDKQDKQNGHGSLSAAEAALRVARLQADSRRVRAARGPRQTRGIFAASCASDVLFLIDATRSMEKVIDEVKRQVVDIVHGIVDAFYGQADVRLAVVAYRDHETPNPYEWINFTHDVDAVFAFLAKLRTQQSIDTCEDVLGGLDRALRLAWRHPTRCIMHLGNAPAHGHQNHNMDRVDDRFFDTAEPHGLTLAGVCDRMIAARINYVFFRMSDTTDRMVYNIFWRYHKAAPAVARPAGSRDDGSHAGSLTGDLHVEEIDIGNAYRALSHLVVRGVVASSSRTAVRMTTSLTAGRARGLHTKQAHKAAAALGVVVEDAPTDDFSVGEKGKDVPTDAGSPVDRALARRAGTVGGTATTSASGATLVVDEGDDDNDDDDDDDGFWQRRMVSVEDGPPRWGEEGWLDQTLRVRAFSPDVVGLWPTDKGGGHGSGDDASTLLDRMVASDDNIPISTTDLTVHRRSRPFAQGALRTVAYARTEASPAPLVVKAFKTPKQLADLVEDMRMQALAKAFALEFNALVGEDQYALDFVVVSCLEPVAVLNGPANGPLDTCLLLEPLLPTDGGAYRKYNNNCGDVSHYGVEEAVLNQMGPSVREGYPAYQEWKKKTKKTTTTLKTAAGETVKVQLRASKLQEALKRAEAAWGAANAPARAASTAAQAFSHYTYERSRGRLLVVDLQGVGGVLTDPVVHTRDPARFALSDTNLNADGFKLFFATHRCNALCARLRLQDAAVAARALFRADAADPGAGFRTDWAPPSRWRLRGVGGGGSSGSTPSAVCCANKLCGRLVAGAGADAAAAHTGPPGFVWCAGCWPQLAATATTRTCAASSDTTPHTFAVSAFFYASQGQVLPDACAAHGGVVVDAAQFAAEAQMAARARPSLLGRLRGWTAR